MADSISV